MHAHSSTTSSAESALSWGRTHVGQVADRGRGARALPARPQEARVHQDPGADPALIAGETAVHGGICCTKQELADRLNRNEKTVSRLIKGLRERGYIEAQMRYGADGGQLPSLYRTVAPGPRSGKGQA